MYTVTGMSYMREHNLFIFLRSTHMCMYVYTVLVIHHVYRYLINNIAYISTFTQMFKFSLLNF